MRSSDSYITSLKTSLLLLLLLLHDGDQSTDHDHEAD
jgi:hypothetical protein